MFILRNILTPLQNEFSTTTLGRQRSRWFVYVLLAFIVPFTNSISSNILRSLNTLFGLSVNRRRFYTFMASNKLPWIKLWHGLWDMIPNPLTDGRLLIALDDFINPKTGRKIFGCAHFFDHAAKANQSKYPWAQNVVLVGLLKRIKGRWACLPLAHRFYLPKKAIASKSDNMTVPGEATLFQTKLEQATEMLVQTDLDLSIKQIIEYYGARWKIESGFKEIKQEIDSSKSQTHSAHAVINHINFSMMAATVTWIYGARLENIPKRRHKVRGRNSFAFSDLRHIIAKAALSENFDAVCGNHLKALKKLFVNALLRMVA